MTKVEEAKVEAEAERKNQQEEVKAEAIVKVEEASIREIERNQDPSRNREYDQEANPEIRENLVQSQSLMKVLNLCVKQVRKEEQ